MLDIWEDLLGSTFALSEYLQKDIFDMTQASSMINATIQAIRNKRTDKEFKKKFEQSVKIAVDEDIDPALNAPRIRRRKKMPGEAADDEHVTNPYE